MLLLGFDIFINYLFLIVHNYLFAQHLTKCIVEATRDMMTRMSQSWCLQTEKNKNHDTPCDFIFTVFRKKFNESTKKIAWIIALDS